MLLLVGEYREMIQFQAFKILHRQGNLAHTGDI